MQPETGISIYIRAEHDHITSSGHGTHAQQMIVEQWVPLSEAMIEKASAPDVFDNPFLNRSVYGGRKRRLAQMSCGGHDSGGRHSTIHPETSAAPSPLARHIRAVCHSFKRTSCGRPNWTINCSFSDTDDIDLKDSYCTCRATIPVQIICLYMLKLSCMVLVWGKAQLLYQIFRTSISPLLFGRAGATFRASNNCFLLGCAFVFRRAFVSTF